MSKLFECIIGKKSSYTPIWFMRQAGRYLPEFQEIRKKNPDFIKLCLTPSLVKEITLQPIKRFNLDAAIIFSDILMVPYGLGQKVEFKKGLGPVLGKLDIDLIANNQPDKFTEKLQSVYESIGEVKKQSIEKEVIGFVGAPWTLLVYMINQKSPKKDFDIRTILKDENLTQRLLKIIEGRICLHIDHQINAGADVIQIFDSWAGLLPKEMLEKYCYIPNLRIVNHIKSKNVPSISFPKGIGKNYLDFCKIVKPSCISIDYELDPNGVLENLKDTPVQGGLHPKILLKDKKNLKEAVERYMNIFSDYPYIFNLGHGVLPETNPDTIKFIVNLIRERNERRSSRN